MTDYIPSEGDLVGSYAAWGKASYLDADQGDREYLKEEGLAKKAIARIKAEVWDERENAKPQYLGPENGHYEDCLGYGDCYCATYPNPYREEAQNG